MSQATDINDENQVVGVSYSDFQFDNPRAFIYQNNTITPLNALIGSASANWDISSTGGINDRGVIAAQANIVSNGVVTSVAHAVLLVPCDPDDQEAYGSSHEVVIPENVQREMRNGVRIGHFHLPLKPE